MLEPYRDFFKEFVPTDGFSNEILRKLYNFAREIDAPMQWLFHCTRPLGIIRQDGWISSEAKLEAGKIFSEQKWLYSAQYFDLVDKIMDSKLTCLCLHETLENFF